VGSTGINKQWGLAAGAPTCRIMQYSQFAGTFITNGDSRHDMS